MTLSAHAKWLYPLLAILVLTPFTPWLDMAIATHFYESKHFVTNTLTDNLFDYGVVPAQVVAAMAVFAYLLSFVRSQWKHWRKACLVLILTMAVGEGLIIHGVLKDHWGRPRPKQVEQFGGEQEFRPYYKPYFSNPIPSKSFVCGHCGMGFFFLAFTILGWRYHNKLLIWVGLIVGLGLGTVMGISRMAQGGHFLTDVLWAGFIIWLSAILSDHLVFTQMDKHERTYTTSK